MPRLREDEAGGITEHRIDDAGRITLTADQRAVFDDGRVFLMLWLLDGCLRLCTAEKLEELKLAVQEEWKGRRLRDSAYRRSVGTVRRLTIDESGRIRIPYIYLDFVQLDGHGKKAWLVPLDEGLYELWNPEQFRAAVAQDLYEMAAAVAEPAAAVGVGGEAAGEASDG